MKFLAITLLFCAIAFCGAAQTVLNGDFELNGANDCQFNLDNPEFDDLMEHATAFGPNDELDIQTKVCGYAEPPSNDWFISLSKRPDGNYDALSLELSANLTEGLTYNMAYWEFAEDTFSNGTVPLHFGLSTDPDNFGELIYTSQPILNAWTQRHFSFVAPNDGGYISLKIGDMDGAKGWNFVDNIELLGVSGVAEAKMAETVAVYPNPTATGHFWVDIPLDAVKVEVFNAVGQLLQSRAATARTSLDFDMVGNGFYLVKVTTQKGEITKKLLVNH